MIQYIKQYDTVCAKLLYLCICIIKWTRWKRRYSSACLGFLRATAWSTWIQSVRNPKCIRIYSIVRNQKCIRIYFIVRKSNRDWALPAQFRIKPSVQDRRHDSQCLRHCYHDRQVHCPGRGPISTLGTLWWDNTSVLGILCRDYTSTLCVLCREHACIITCTYQCKIPHALYTVIQRQHHSTAVRSEKVLA